MELIISADFVELIRNGARGKSFRTIVDQNTVSITLNCSST